MIHLHINFHNVEEEGVKMVINKREHSIIPKKGMIVMISNDHIGVQIKNILETHPDTFVLYREYLRKPNSLINMNQDRGGIFLEDFYGRLEQSCITDMEIPNYFVVETCDVRSQKYNMMREYKIEVIDYDHLLHMLQQMPPVSHEDTMNVHLQAVGE